MVFRKINLQNNMGNEHIRCIEIWRLGLSVRGLYRGNEHIRCIEINNLADFDKKHSVGNEHIRCIEIWSK